MLRVGCLAAVGCTAGKEGHMSPVRTLISYLLGWCSSSLAIALSLPLSLSLCRSCTDVVIGLDDGTVILLMRGLLMYQHIPLSSLLEVAMWRQNNSSDLCQCLIVKTKSSPRPPTSWSQCLRREKWVLLFNVGPKSFKNGSYICQKSVRKLSVMSYKNMSENHKVASAFSMRDLSHVATYNAPWFFSSRHHRSKIVIT